MAKKARAPWKRSNPRKRAGKSSKHLSPAQKSAGESARPPRRPPLSQPRGQHAHGSEEEVLQEEDDQENLQESFEIEILESKVEDVSEEDPQAHREEGQVFPSAAHPRAKRIRAAA
ncbi:hypothetical protein ACU4GH_01515 [Bradyrhizobium betae]